MPPRDTLSLEELAGQMAALRDQVQAQEEALNTVRSERDELQRLLAERSEEEERSAPAGGSRLAPGEMLVTNINEVTRNAPHFAASDSDRQTPLEFAKEIEVIGKAYGFDDLRLRRLAALQLRGAARDWYLEVVRSGPPFASYPDFVERFCAMYQVVGAKEASMGELTRLSQGAQESVWSFRNRLMGAFRRYENAGGTLTEDVKMQYFKQKLLPPLRQALKTAALQNHLRDTPEEISMEKAVRYLQSLQDEKNQQSGRKYNGYTADGGESTPVKAHALRFHGGDGRRPQQQQYQQRPQQKHYQQQRPQQQQQPQRRPLPKAEFEHCWKEGLCFDCKQKWYPGHKEECTGGAPPNARRA